MVTFCLKLLKLARIEMNFNFFGNLRICVLGTWLEALDMFLLLFWGH